MEMNVPLVLVFNMSDIAKQRGLQFDINKLSELLAAPIVETVGNKAKGIDELLDVIANTTKQGAKSTADRLNYGDEIEEELTKLTKQIKRPTKVTTKYPKRWLAIKLLEHDKEIMAKGFSDGLLEAVDVSRRHLAAIFGDEPEMVIADAATVSYQVPVRRPSKAPPTSDTI